MTSISSLGNFANDITTAAAFDFSTVEFVTLSFNLLLSFLAMDIAGRHSSYKLHSRSDGVSMKKKGSLLGHRSYIQLEGLIGLRVSRQMTLRAFLYPGRHLGNNLCFAHILQWSWVFLGICR